MDWGLAIGAVLALTVLYVVACGLLRVALPSEDGRIEAAAAAQSDEEQQ